MSPKGGWQSVSAWRHEIQTLNHSMVGQVISQGRRTLPGASRHARTERALSRLCGTVFLGHEPPGLRGELPLTLSTRASRSVPRQ